MKTIRVCVGSACHVTGSYQVVQAFNRLIDEQNLKDEVELVGSFCMGHCAEGVSVEYDDVVYSVSLKNVEEIFNQIIGEK
jgi:NADH:ubiquinone oxidoreductase subunit E